MVVFWDVWGWLGPALSEIGECVTVVGMNAVVCYLFCGIFLNLSDICVFEMIGVVVVVI